VNEDIEPKDLAPGEVHEKLASASAKLILLKMMLPKLRERGHRILLFSQVLFPAY
jgi:chromodomain-helicase-DNA-binding protein 4